MDIYNGVQIDKYSC